MKSIAPLSIGLGLFGSAFSEPLESRQIQVAHLTFHTEANDYFLYALTDGSTLYTNSNLTVHTIDAPDYNAQHQCNFVFDAEVQPEIQFQVTEDLLQQLVIEPPTVLKTVTCEGTCVLGTGTCFDSAAGSFIGPCCTGYCDDLGDYNCHAWGPTTA